MEYRSRNHECMQICPFSSPGDPYSLIFFTTTRFSAYLLTKNRTWRNDGDGGGGRGVPTTLAQCSSPSLNARREKISRAGKPLTLIWALFQKLLPWPNHSAHMKGIEILCKTAVSMSRDVSSESKSIGANSKYSSPAGM